MTYQINVTSKKASSKSYENSISRLRNNSTSGPFTSLGLTALHRCTLQLPTHPPNKCKSPSQVHCARTALQFVHFLRLRFIRRAASCVSPCSPAVGPSMARLWPAQRRKPQKQVLRSKRRQGMAPLRHEIFFVNKKDTGPGPPWPAPLRGLCFDKRSESPPQCRAIHGPARLRPYGLGLVKTAVAQAKVLALTTGQLQTQLKKLPGCGSEGSRSGLPAPLFPRCLRHLRQKRAGALKSHRAHFAFKRRGPRQ